MIGFSNCFVAEEDERLVTGVFKVAESKEQGLRKAISLIRVLCWPSPDSWVCVAKSLRCSPDTITTLLTGYTPIQNVFGIKKNKLIKIKFKQKLININGKNQWNQKLFLYKDFLKIDKPLVKLITTTTNKRYKLLI